MDFHLHAVILAIIEDLKRRGSRAGKTHVLKTLFLASAAGLLKPPMDFFLYKHGPYTDDVEKQLEQMKSYGALTAEPASDGYGVILQPGEMAGSPKQRAPLTREEQEAIGRVCAFVGARNVYELERLATAAWIRTRENVQDPDVVARRLNELKPHISLADARHADREVVSFFNG